MTLHDSGERPHVPRQSFPENNGHGPNRPPRKVPRNWKTYVVLALLIGIPLGYLWISTQQSRDSGRDKAAKAEAKGLTDDWPSGATRRIYSVPIPEGATKVAYYETNSLHTSSLYAEFTTTPEKFDKFLDNVGTRSSALEEGYNPITPKRAGVVGWKFDEGKGKWSGVLHEQPGATPDLAIAVDLDDPEKPAARVVSTTDY